MTLTVISSACVAITLGSLVLIHHMHIVIIFYMHYKNTEYMVTYQVRLTVLLLNLSFNQPYQWYG